MTEAVVTPVQRCKGKILFHDQHVTDQITHIEVVRACVNRKKTEQCGIMKEDFIKSKNVHINFEILTIIGLGR